MAQIGITPVTGVIAQGQSLSSPIPLGVGRANGILIPAGWVAANLTFQVSVDGGVTWYEMYDGNGNEVTVGGSAGQYLAFNQPTTQLFAGVNMIKVRSGTAAAPVNQTQAGGITIAISTQVF